MTVTIECSSCHAQGGGHDVGCSHEALAAGRRLDRGQPGRPLPGTSSVCQLCKARVVWARTVASDTNRGGVMQAFDPHEHPDGNVAIINRGNGRLLARALHKGETHDREVEYLGMPHAATCKAPPKTALPANVIDLAAARARKARR